MQTAKKIFKYLLIFFIVSILYVATAVPVGLFIYSWKSKSDIDFFTKTGFHGYLTCIATEARKAKINKNMIRDSKLEQAK